MTIAWLGTGLLGANFVRALRKKGEAVRVWNRTAHKARALEETGARAFDDAFEAARGATRVHMTLSDDAAVEAVMESARLGLDPGVTVIDHSTTSPEATRRRVESWNALGVRFVHAPVFMGPQNALEGTGTMLVSGDRARVDLVRPWLETMTGTVVDLGSKEESAASFKLLGNMFLMFLTTGLADMLALGKALDVPPTSVTSLFEFFNPGATIASRAKRMTDADFDNPSWELSMARKDARIMLETASRANVPLAVLPAIAARMDEVITAGHGSRDWTVLGLDALAPKK